MAPDQPARTYSVHAIHLVRTMQQMTLTFSQMADAKASMLMGATFLVFTISIGQASHGHLPWSLTILAMSAFSSALCAMLAVLPAVGQPSQKSNNKLFFGHFSQMTEEEWITSLLPELQADETIFRTMMRDTYQNGLVLQRKKYRLLGYAYRIFLVGMCLTTLAFAVERLAQI